MKPLIHAKQSVKKYGGTVEDYLPIHNWFDQTKSAVPDMRHRTVLHNAFGIFLCEQVFGVYIVNSDNKKVSVRDIGEEHVIQDLGFIPTLEHYLKNMKLVPWMSGTQKRKTTFKYKKVD